MPIPVANPRKEIVSYLTLRRVVGFLGILLPVAVFLYGRLYGWPLQDSISSYYHTPARDVFVGILFVIGFFLYTYYGYENPRFGFQAWDNVVTNVAGVLAIGVALFPTESRVEWIGWLHLFFAASLFLLLAYISICLFTKTKPGGEPSPQKLVRNHVYRRCGWAIVWAIVLIAVYWLFLDDGALDRFKPVFWLEALALWAFGASWFVKGETLWADT